ncbi:hypothetical protein C0J52_13671, partial [Blattella germanica]
IPSIIRFSLRIVLDPLLFLLVPLNDTIQTKAVCIRSDNERPTCPTRRMVERLNQSRRQSEFPRTIGHIGKLMHEAIDNVTQEYWISQVRHAEQLQEDDFLKEVASDELTLEACKVGSVRSIGRIISEGKKSVLQSNVPIIKSPGKRHDRPKIKTDLDDFEKDVLRRTIMQFYDDGQYPTAKKLTMAMREKINYQGSIASMYCILRNLGFRYRKCNDGRKFLMERGDIVAARLAFLRKMNNLRISKDERPRIYLDETWVNQNHSRNYIWQDSHGNGGLKKLSNRAFVTSQSVTGGLRNRTGDIFERLPAPDAVACDDESPQTPTT